MTVKGTKTGKLENCADVAAADGLKGRSCATTIITQPSLELTKSAPAEVLLCDVIPYAITVRNTGDAPATNVRISDELPEGLSMLDGRKTAVFEIGTLAAGEAKVGKVDVKAAKTGAYTNTATATGDSGLKATASAKTVVRQPVLVLTKTGPKLRFVGRSLDYTLTLTNKGDGPARNTVLVDEVPAGAEVIGVSNGGKVAGGKITWQVGTPNPNDTVRATVRLKPTQQGELRNVASATAYCAKASGEAVTTIKGIPAILLECVDVEDPIEVGSKVTYIITVTNQGSSVGTNIVVTCTLPAEQEFVSAAGPTKETVEGKSVKFAPLKSLAPQAKATYRIVTKGIKAGDVRFKVTLKSDQMDTPAGETESTHIYSDE